MAQTCAPELHPRRSGSSAHPGRAGVPAHVQASSRFETNSARVSHPKRLCLRGAPGTQDPGEKSRRRGRGGWRTPLLTLTRDTRRPQSTIGCIGADGCKVAAPRRGTRSRHPGLEGHLVPGSTVLTTCSARNPRRGKGRRVTGQSVTSPGIGPDFVGNLRSASERGERVMGHLPAQAPTPFLLRPRILPSCLLPPPPPQQPRPLEAHGGHSVYRAAVLDVYSQLIAYAGKCSLPGPSASALRQSTRRRQLAHPTREATKGPAAGRRRCHRGPSHQHCSGLPVGGASSGGRPAPVQAS